MVLFHLQSADRQEEGTHKEANECVYGLGSSRTSRHVKTISQPPELRAQQIIGKIMEVSFRRRLMKIVKKNFHKIYQIRS